MIFILIHVRGKYQFDTIISLLYHSRPELDVFDKF